MNDILNERNNVLEENNIYKKIWLNYKLFGSNADKPLYPSKLEKYAKY